MNWAMPGSTGSIDIWTTEKPKPSQTVEKALFAPAHTGDFFLPARPRLLRNRSPVDALFTKRRSRITQRLNLQNRVGFASLFAAADRRTKRLGASGLGGEKERPF